MTFGACISKSYVHSCATVCMYEIFSFEVLIAIKTKPKTMSFTITLHKSSAVQQLTKGLKQNKPPAGLLSRSPRYDFPITRPMDAPADFNPTVLPCRPLKIRSVQVGAPSRVLHIHCMLHELGAPTLFAGDEPQRYFLRVIVHS